MRMRKNNSEKIKGAEAIVVHGKNIVLGMQKTKRWYNLAREEKAAIIKTLGGKIEKKDKDDSKRALIREILEEIKGIEENDIIMTENPIFTKKIRMGDLNLFEESSNLIMEADFYLLKINSKKNIEPNDLPALLEMPIEEFLKLDFTKKGKTQKMKKYIIKNNDFQSNLPEYYALMIPKEVKKYI